MSLNRPVSSVKYALALSLWVLTVSASAQTPVSSPVATASESGKSTVFSKKAVLLKVPFKKQTEPNLCGVAAIEMISGYYNQKLNDSQYHYLKLDAKQNNGIAGATLEVVLRASDYYTAVFPGTLDDKTTSLYYHLDMERPLIVMVSSADGKTNHYLVLTGYDPEKSLIVASDPAGEGSVTLSVDDFKKGWARANYFTLVAVPKSLDTDESE